MASELEHRVAALELAVDELRAQHAVDVGVLQAGLERLRSFLGFLGRQLAWLGEDPVAAVSASEAEPWPRGTP